MGAAGLKNIVSVFARLDEPIDFEALDDEPVDLIFLLLAPEHAGADHLKALARISRLLREPATIEKLRASRRPRGALLGADRARRRTPRERWCLAEAGRRTDCRALRPSLGVGLAELQPVEMDGNPRPAACSPPP